MERRNNGFLYARWEPDGERITCVLPSDDLPHDATPMTEPNDPPIENPSDHSDHPDAMDDLDDPEVEARWLHERREEILAYLHGEGLQDARVGEEPAWWVAPYVAIWGVVSSQHPDTVTRWAICGDVPGDHVSVDRAADPREAMRAFATLWAEAATYMARGERHPTFMIGDGSQDAALAPMLASRAELLQEWADDSELWD